jgi:hypothetical protein
VFFYIDKVEGWDSSHPIVEGYDAELEGNVLKVARLVVSAEFDDERVLGVLVEGDVVDGRAIVTRKEALLVYWPNLKATLHVDQRLELLEA